MDILSNELWLQDIDCTIDSMPFLAELDGKSILITGAAGLICSSVADILIRYNETHNQKIFIKVAGRNTERLLKRFHPYSEKEYFQAVFYDAAENDELNISCDYMIHGASNASPNRIIREPVETMLSNFTGMYRLLDCAARNHSKRILFISSSEVYGKKSTCEPFEENDYGFIDLLNPRNSYSIAKRTAETLCASYHAEYGVESVIVRPGHIYGPTASRTDNRVSSEWAYMAAAGKDIVMKSDGSQLRSYCYCLDCASAILTVLLKGEALNAYNISSDECIISIKDMASILADSGTVKLIRQEATAEERKAFNPMMNSSLNGDKLRNLGWRACFSPDSGFLHTVEILKAVSFSTM